MVRACNVCDIQCAIYSVRYVVRVSLLDDMRQAGHRALTVNMNGDTSHTVTRLLHTLTLLTVSTL